MRRLLERRARRALFVVLLAAGVLAAASAGAELPTARELTTRLGITEAEVQNALSGGFVAHAMKPSDERGLTAGFSFLVKGMASPSGSGSCARSCPKRSIRTS